MGTYQLKLRRYLYEILDGSGKHHRTRRLVNLGLVALIATNVMAVILETVASVVTGREDWFYAFEVVSVIIFSIEYLARIWVVVERNSEEYKHPLWGRLRYFTTPMALIDLVAIMPFFLAFVVTFDLRFIRVFRLLRLLKIGRYSAALSLVGSVLYIERRPLGAAAMVMFVLLVFASSFVYLAERTAQPEDFSSIPAAMWWGIATLTTVGYGDVTPVTPIGKFLGMIVMLLGVGMFAMPAGILASGFAQAVKSRDFVVSWNMVASVPLFSRLEASRIAEIVALLKPRLAVPGESIIRKGAVADRMYFLSAGEVLVETPGKPIDLHAGDFFGEIALLDHSVRTADVVAVTSCQLLTLEGSDLEELLRSDAELAATIRRIAQSRRSELSEDEGEGEGEGKGKGEAEDDRNA